MLGSFRLFLAWLVMLSHYPKIAFVSGLNLGVVAVILFYFISGYLMYGSFERVKSAKKFYFSRFLRLYPIYFIVLILTIIALNIFGKEPSLPILDPNISLEKGVLNFMMLFNNYVFPPWQIDSLLPHPLIPPSWSLSTEIHFYILVPLLFGLINHNVGKRWFYAIFLSSFALNLYAHTSHTPEFNSDNFGYRYIFGVLWIFMSGFLWAKTAGKSKFLKHIYIYTLLFFMFAMPTFNATAPYSREVLLGVLLSPTILAVLKIDFSKNIDKKLGSLSYPLFLSHFLIFYIALRLKIENFLLIALMILLFSYLLSLIQAKIDIYRYRNIKSRI
jgi:peptidoglycan/LPS O-acetylase OafA/YrhL